MTEKQKSPARPGLVTRLMFYQRAVRMQARLTSCLQLAWRGSYLASFAIWCESRDTFRLALFL
jgi:hypothetical protein